MEKSNRVFYEDPQSWRQSGKVNGGNGGKITREKRKVEVRETVVD